ncbi:MAG: DmsC/YnfH family molybdoenzyme membrane anchor subunit [Gammaproteobacteria bacterium]|nr:DmsC/YnfH family molybdoenzyme membrane anchor subunit [Gammaproteobacteria bacterium]
MFQKRENEPNYALLNDPSSQRLNRYGIPIDTVQEDDWRHGLSLKINNDDAIGDNPNRYRQHGFYFNADNCIACHACEAACSEKNDNPAHISFRSVGFVEGGTYPAYQRLNISITCNHCDDPVCLKGCPTRAYTKFAEYGAVLQDPDICFGCGYCTWVCPYNAPQLDPVKGQVSKCNMCVDRLEVGLKPACVSACLGNALDFGVVENIPENRTQAKTDIPGFPRTDITHPNIRFQQTRTPQRDMNRVDQSPVKYHREENSESFKSVVDVKQASKREWNWGRLLGSHENAHIAFTLSAQTVMAAFLIVLSGHLFAPMKNFLASGTMLPTLLLMVLLMSFGLFKLNMHLGKPHRFYRGFYNLRHSPVSREIAGVSAFYTGLLGYGFFALFNNDYAQLLQILFAGVAVLGAGFGGYFMYRLYRIAARPFWNHWYTAASFSATGLTLGALLIAIMTLTFASMTDTLGQLLLIMIVTGLMLEIVGLTGHAGSLQSSNSEGAASFYLQTTRYGNAYWLRNGMLALALLLAAYMMVYENHSLFAFSLLAVIGLASNIISRALFYVVVIPTTMPGAFFWKNADFVEHAREVGLADMPQLGVAYETHHAFNLAELLETIKATTMKEKFAQLRCIFTG